MYDRSIRLVLLVTLKLLDLVNMAELGLLMKLPPFVREANLCLECIGEKASMDAKEKLCSELFFSIPGIRFFLFSRPRLIVFGYMCLEL